jgi:dTDP-4-dehydrorhamnose reductase
MSTNNIVVLGSSGQVASALKNVLPNAKFLGRAELDLTNPNFAALDIYKPTIIINTAAYTAVDKAESEQELCNQINHLAVAELASYCKKTGTLLVQFSTDYVFDGNGTEPFTEDNTDSLNPVNFYGKTKLDGERVIIATGCDYLILRTSWVYYHTGTNFLKTMLRLAETKTELSVVNDQTGSPTYAADIAENTKKLLDLNIKNQIINFVPDEQVTWFDFANLIFKTAGKNILVNPIPTSAYPTPAKRPHNSRLNTAKLKSYKIYFPHLQDSVTRCINKICN